jgi:hypothetical protein
MELMRTENVEMNKFKGVTKINAYVTISRIKKFYYVFCNKTTIQRTRSER